jgi:hypothetical protein
VQDQHVDRPGVEVGQPMKLTGSDRPSDSDPVARCQLSAFGRQLSEATDLTAVTITARRSLSSPAHRTTRTSPFSRQHAADVETTTVEPAPLKTDDRKLTTASWTGRPGGFGGGPAPDPFPNSAVKTPSAHGTVSQGTGE